MKDRKPSDPARRRPGHQSLFFKIFMVLLGSVLLTYLVFGGFYRPFWNASARAERNMFPVHFTELLSREIGYPPDTVIASRLSRDMRIAIGIKGPSVNWRSEGFSDYIWSHTYQNPPRDSVQK